MLTGIFDNGRSAAPSPGMVGVQTSKVRHALAPLILGSERCVPQETIVLPMGRQDNPTHL
jgi:hypothetical protein